MKKCSCCCCGIALSTASILLLITNIILDGLHLGFSLFHYGSLSTKHFFSDNVEMSMTYIFAVISTVVFFSAIVSSFKKTSFMLTLAIVMLFLESAYIIFITARVYYNDIWIDIWLRGIKPAILSILDENSKQVFSQDEQTMYTVSLIAFFSICSLVIVFKLWCVTVLNNFKNQLEINRFEDIFYQLMTGRGRSSASRPSSYIYSTKPIDTPFY